MPQFCMDSLGSFANRGKGEQEMAEMAKMVEAGRTTREGCEREPDTDNKHAPTI